MPTAKLISSCLGTIGCDFSEYADALVGGGQLIYDQVPDPAHPGQTTSVPFSNNVIRANRLSPQALALLTLMQPYAPNTGGTGLGAIENNYAASGTGLFNSNSWTVRGDYTLNEKAHAFARFSRFWDTLSGKVMFGDAGGPGFGIGNYGGNSNGANDSLSSGMDIAMSPSLLTDFRLAYYRYNVIDSKYDAGVDFAQKTLNIPGINTGNSFTSGAPGFLNNFPFDPNNPNQSKIGGGLGINRCNCPLTEREDQFQIVNNWTKVLGNHSVKVGVDLRYGRNLRVPSDHDRAGALTFNTGQTSNNGTDGLGFASFVLGEVGSFDRYVSTSTNAKEFQKRTFFYGQDTWRVTHNLTLNLGLRWELYFPEKVNAASNGALMNLNDGYMHVAGVGGIDTNMGWDIEKKKGFDPRIGATYQLNDKTVIRAGYGRSFDTGVFGSIFGHVVTQNLPVLADQTINSPSTTAAAFNLADGPVAFTFPTVPSNGLLPAQGYSVSPKARPNPLHFPTIDAWNLAFQRAVTPTLNLTIAYVANKGTHTLGDTDQNNTDPNESALFLPGAYSRNGQTLHWDPSAPGISATSDGIAPDGGVSNARLLKRYYAGSLPACKDANYIALTNSDPNNKGLREIDGDPNLQAGQCGWTNNISYYGDDENTEFDALQVTVAKQLSKGLSVTANYQWASAFGDTNGFWTWSHVVTHLRDSNVRTQSMVAYGSYDLPFGKGKQFAPGVNRITDLIIGGYQLSGTVNVSNGLPFSVGFSNFGGNQDCNHATGGSAAPCRPNANGHMKTNLSGFDPVSHSRSFWDPQPKTGGVFSFPGLDQIGNAGANTYTGPGFFNADLGLTKSFSIHESVEAKFRMDAYNAFNHIVPGNPNSNDIFSNGSIHSGTGYNGNGMSPGSLPRQLEFSARIQF